MEVSNSFLIHLSSAWNLACLETVSRWVSGSEWLPDVTSCWGVVGIQSWLWRSFWEGLFFFFGFSFFLRCESVTGRLCGPLSQPSQNSVGFFSEAPLRRLLQIKWLWKRNCLKHSTAEKVFFRIKNAPQFTQALDAHISHLSLLLLPVDTLCIVCIYIYLYI